MYPAFLWGCVYDKEKTIKTCSLCLRKLKKSEFNKNKRTKDKLSFWCRPCRKNKDKEYYLKNQNERKIKDKSYRQQNKNKIKIRNQKYYQNHKDDDNFKQKTKLYRKYNNRKPDTKKKKSEYYQNTKERDKEKRLINDRNYYNRNKNKVIQKVLNWQKRNPDKKRATDHNYRSRLYANGGKIKSDIVSEVLQSNNGFCQYCNKNKANSVDHIIPLSKGGTNNRDNLAPACSSCNSSKKDKLLSEWKRYGT